ncbi:MAG: DUF3015 domain-containing protein [Gammaproteobacteria bacterium]|nr:DUF3015 domain-containing protein [Gammaproteobacteria bacterium]MBQ0838232.1 DUF3015 domain-containing protein [Gammaproteobacteria bacterium]
MKNKILAGLAVACLSTGALADPDTHGCGWGSLLFEGTSGLAPYVLASTTNGVLMNAPLGMTSNTNGCQTHHPINYGGKSWFAAAEFADDIVEDIAKGEGEALDALATMIGIEQQDRAYFAQLTHQNFAVIAPTSEVTGEQVMQAIDKLLTADNRLAKYVAS